MHTIVIDTNVLLADPNVVFAFPDSELIIPETVLGELDKLKTSRVDPDLRFRGREVSRILFELSEQGSLIEGVELPDGGRLRVVPFDSDVDMPEGLAARNSDDRILATAVHVCANGCEDGLTLVTNDLNMLLKAQTFGLEVQRHAEDSEGTFTRRYIIRPFQRYKVPLGILSMSLAVFAAIVFLVIWAPGLTGRSTDAIPQEFRDLLSGEQRQALDYLTRLRDQPNDTEALLGMANYYYGLRDRSGEIRHARQAIQYYQRYLEINPDDINARADMAASLYYTGNTDAALQEIDRVLQVEPDHLQANFNLGIFYWRGRQDFVGALAQFERVIELTEDPSTPEAQLARQQAQRNVEQVREEAQQAGQPLPPAEGILQ